MVQSSAFKTQILLNDYSYQKDIEYRSLISTLSSVEIEVLQEILHDSLRISVNDLANNLELDLNDLIPVLDALTRTKLFKREGLTLLVDKERRKFYEFHFDKFNSGFEPNLEFLQNLLSNVPLNVLLGWYSIPKSADNIFDSIIQECLLTPKIYRQYLGELKFEDPLLHAIVKDLYSAPDFKLSAKEIIAKYGLTREQFEKYLISLEYHFVCCLNYDKVENEWHEVITPFAEWHNYLQKEIGSQFSPINSKEKVEDACENDFGFIEDLTTVLKRITQKSPSPFAAPLNLTTPSHLKALESKLYQLNFVKTLPKSTLEVTEKGLIWMAKPLQEKAAALAVDPLNSVAGFKDSALWNIRNIHLIEKSLRNLRSLEWIYLEDFLKSISFPLGDKHPTKLHKKGKKWRYVMPEYSPEELEFISKVIMERCFELGIAKIGHHEGKACFCLTQFGSHFIH